MPTTDSNAAALAAFHFTAVLGEQRRTLHSRRLMLALSFAIEEIAASIPDTVLIAAFQCLSLAGLQSRRYARLTPHLAHTYILGLPDAELPAFPRTTIVPLEPTWPLLHEWVVLASGPACCVGLFAQDGDASQPAARSRQFQGFWSTDPKIIDRAEEGFFTASGLPHTLPQRDSRALRDANQRIQQAIAARLRKINAG